MAGRKAGWKEGCLGNLTRSSKEDISLYSLLDKSLKLKEIDQEHQRGYMIILLTRRVLKLKRIYEYILY